MKRILALIILALIAGCSTVYDPIAEQAVSEAADNLLAKGIYAACVAPTIGAINRRFANPDDRQRYIDACLWMRGN